MTSETEFILAVIATSIALVMCLFTGGQLLAMVRPILQERKHHCYLATPIRRANVRACSNDTTGVDSGLHSALNHSEEPSRPTPSLVRVPLSKRTICG